jgi:hypothetical protein
VVVGGLKILSGVSFRRRPGAPGLRLAAGERPAQVRRVFLAAFVQTVDRKPDSGFPVQDAMAPARGHLGAVCLLRVAPERAGHVAAIDDMGHTDRRITVLREDGECPAVGPHRREQGLS